MEAKTPFKRDYLKEAYKIYKGAKIPTRKEHVKAAMEALVDLQKQTENLRQLMEYAYNEAVKKRAENGLPPPVKPPSLTKGRTFD